MIWCCYLYSTLYFPKNLFCHYSQYKLLIRGRLYKSYM